MAFNQLFRWAWSAMVVAGQASNIDGPVGSNTRWVYKGTFGLKCINKGIRAQAGHQRKIGNTIDAELDFRPVLL